MTSTAHIIIYLASNTLRVFSDYLFFESLLFDKKIKANIPCFIIFYILNSSFHVLFSIPLINILVNLIGLFALTCLYSASIKHRIVSIVFLYTIAVFSETIVLAFTHFTSFSIFRKASYNSMFGTACMSFIFFILVILFRRWSERRQGILIPLSYTLSILVIPMSFIVITIFLVVYVPIAEWQFSVIVTLLFIISIGAYTLYDRQIAFFQNQNDLRILEAQNRYYRTQLDIIRENNETIKKVEHDLKNHLLTIQSLSDKENSIKAHDYIDHLKNDLFQIDQRFDTDNPVIDGILNMKASAAKENGTPIHADLQLPANCSLDDFDATILLGNMLDNAIENSSGDISLTIRYSKGRLFITCSNPFSGKRKRSGSVFLSTKDNPSIHGYGYKNMLRIAEKYEGSIVCDDADGVFKISVMLMLPSKP